MNTIVSILNLREKKCRMTLFRRKLIYNCATDAEQTCEEKKFNESFLLLIFCVSFLRLHLALWKKFIVDAQNSLSHETDINLPQYSNKYSYLSRVFFSGSLLCYTALAMLSLRFFPGTAVLVSAAIRLLLKNTQHFLAICTVSVSSLFLPLSFSLHLEHRVSIKFTPAHSSALTFIAHEFAMCPNEQELHEAKREQQAQDETNSTFFIFNARENHCARRCTT